MAGLHAASYVCDDCLAPTRDLERHACKLVCYSCKSPDCKPKEVEVRVKCNVCNRYFYNDDCIAMHLSNGICKKKFRCKLCWQSGHRDKSPKCFQKKCHICRNWVPLDHLCFIQKENHLYDRYIQFHPTPKYFFYDFECIQESGTHIPNLVICKDEGTIQKQFYGDNRVMALLSHP